MGVKLSSTAKAKAAAHRRRLGRQTLVHVVGGARFLTAAEVARWYAAVDAARTRA